MANLPSHIASIMGYMQRLYGPATDTSALASKYCVTFFVLLLSVQTVVSHALPNDKEQPIRLTADKALRDEKNGVTIYTGNVQMKQGSVELEADTLTIYHISDEASEIVAEGKINMISNIKFAGCLLAASVALTGCDGNSESMGDITVNVEGDTIDNSTTTPAVTAPVTGDLCSAVVEAGFVTFNDDCMKIHLKPNQHQQNRINLWEFLMFKM